MNESSRSSPVPISAHREQDQFAPHSSLVGSRIETRSPDRQPPFYEPPNLHGIQSLIASQGTSERSVLRRHSSADLDQVTFRPRSETRVEGQFETSISNSGVGRESQDTVTGPASSGAPTQANQSKNTVSSATLTSKQFLTSTLTSQDGHSVSSPEADIFRSTTNPAEIRRHAPLPPLPRASGLGMPQSIKSLTNPHLIRSFQSIDSAVLSSDLDKSSSMIGIASHSNLIPSDSASSARAPGAAHARGHGLETSGMIMDDSIRLDPASNRSYPTLDRSRTLKSRTDWLASAEEKEKTVGERLDPTLETARIERDKYALKAKITGYTLNIAIGLQVLIGALTTGLSAATTGHQTSIATSILGGIATLIASYLARARGSHEPELSTARVKDLEQFIRDCEIFQLDHGHSIGRSNPEQETRLSELRERFEELLGNGNGERRLAPA